MSEKDQDVPALSGLAASFGKKLNVDAPEFVPSFKMNSSTTPVTNEITAPATIISKPTITECSDVDNSDIEKTKLLDDENEVVDDWEANAEDDDEDDEGNSFIVNNVCHFYRNDLTFFFLC